MNYCILKTSFLSLIFLKASFASGYTPQRGNIQATISTYNFKSQVKSSTYFDKFNMNGYGLTAIGDVSNKGSLEISSLFYDKTFFRQMENESLTESSRVVHVTMGYRHWWLERLSSSLSFFTIYPMGNTSVISDTRVYKDFKTAAHEKTAAGFDLAVQLELFSHERWALQFETRYSHLIDKPIGEDPHQLGVGLGLRYFIQSRVAKPKQYKDLNIENN